MIKHPEVKVNLVNEDGNAFFILARCESAMKKAKLSLPEREAFHKEAKSGDYNNLLCTVMDWFTCDENNEDDDYDE